MVDRTRHPVLAMARNELSQNNVNGALGSYNKLIKKARYLDEVIYDLRDALYRYPVDVNLWQSLGDAYMRAKAARTSSRSASWSLEAMEHVCCGEDERRRALDVLDSLVEKGLVRVVGAGEGFALLETIRAFAAEQLHAGGGVDAVRHAHADYFLMLAADVAAGLREPRQLVFMQRARRVCQQQAAIHWLTACARGGDAAALEKVLLLCGHMNWVWHIGAQHFTGRALLDPLLALAEHAPPSRGRAHPFVREIPFKRDRFDKDTRSPQENSLVSS